MQVRLSVFKYLVPGMYAENVEDNIRGITGDPDLSFHYREEEGELDITGLTVNGIQQLFHFFSPKDVEVKMFAVSQMVENRWTDPIDVPFASEEEWAEAMGRYGALAVVPEGEILHKGHRVYSLNSWGGDGKTSRWYAVKIS